MLHVARWVGRVWKSWGGFRHIPGRTAYVGDAAGSFSQKVKRRQDFSHLSGTTWQNDTRSDRLSNADIELLGKDPTAEARALVAKKLGEQAEDLIEDGHQNLVNEIFDLLVKDVEAEVRQSLASAMATSPNLPADIAKRLANDHIKVARPILESSPVLCDKDLIEIVRTSAIQYSLAIAARNSVSEEVSDALVDTGHQTVVERLLDNQGASISGRAYARVADDFKDSDEVRKRLVKRVDLPANVLNRLTESISQSIQSNLVNQGGVDADVAKDLVDSAKQNATILRATRDSDNIRLRRYLCDQMAGGELDHTHVLGFLTSGDIASFEMAMSILSTVDLKRTRKMIYQDDRRRLMALCVAAGFAPNHYLSLQLAVEAAEASLKGGGKPKSRSSSVRNELINQYSRLAQNKTAVNELLTGHVR